MSFYDVIYTIDGISYQVEASANQHALLESDPVRLRNYISRYTEMSDVAEAEDELEVLDKENTGQGQDIYWDEAHTTFLLDQYEQYLKNVGPMKKFKRKKDMWEQISKDLLIRCDVIKTPMQCENRYKTVLKRKKKAVDNNHTSGHSRMPVQYERELSKIAAQDDSIQPEVLRSVDEVNFPKSLTLDNTKPPKKKFKPTKSIQDILLEINKTKEEARERRHQEKLKALQDFGKMLMDMRKRDKDSEADY